ncbi:MAG: ABC transporter substrate-binding protein [Chloroflexi bacterium]|nr:ABC transporter substrate-binding protein [Chloroflexota bacterium]
MTRLLSLIVVIVLAWSILGACAPGAAPAAPAPPAKGGGPAPAAAGWQEKWNNLVAEAKKEGAVSVYTMWTAETRQALTQAFKDKYGINLEFASFGKGSELSAKVETEKRAGLYLADAFGVGAPTMITYMKPQGLLGPIRSSFALPEVSDPKPWRGGEIPFSDKEGLALVMIANTIRTVAYNTSLIKDGEITTYRDMLKPQYKGKITMLDPSITGNSSIAHVGHNLWGEGPTVDFLRKLIKDQEVVITRDNRLHIETVARGKYAIAFAPSMTSLTTFLKAGAPLKMAVVEEDVRISGGSGAVGIPVRFAHPNAAVVFLNWLLSKEGQTVFASSYGSPSSRADVSTEGINPLFVPVAGKKYYMSDTEEFIDAITRWFEIAGKVMEESAR